MKSCPNPQCQQPVPEEALFCPACGNSLQTPTEDPGTSLVGRVLNQKYRLISELAEGGMALVYKAEHIFLDDMCAVKIIKKGLSSKEEMLKRFQREAKLTRQVSRRSPYIISIYDFGMEDELGFFYVMELLDGGPFTELLGDPNVPPDARRAVRLTCQICEALDVVHEEGLVHRDIKPDNIFLHRDEGRDEEMVKLLDFGIARPTYAKATMLTNYGRVMGTPEYMSPEQCRGPTPQQYERGESHLDGRSDIYSLGVLLYQCVTGDVPFPMPVDGGPMAIHKVMAGHVMEEAVPPTEKRPDLTIPPGLSNVVLKAMAKEPEARFQTMLEFRDALLEVFPDVANEFKGGSSEGEGKGHLDTLPISEVGQVSEDFLVPDSIDIAPRSDAGQVSEDFLVPDSIDVDPQHSPQPDLGPALDRTAMDVQLPPELLAEANRWAQQNYNNPPSQPGGNVLTLQESSGLNPGGVQFDPNNTARDEREASTASPWGQQPPENTPSPLAELDDLAKTVTAPLDPAVMEDLRERARQAAAESSARADAQAPTPIQPTPKTPRASIKPSPSPRPNPNRISSASLDVQSGKKGRSPLIWLAVGLPILLIGGILIFHFFIKNIF